MNKVTSNNTYRCISYRKRSGLKWKIGLEGMLVQYDLTQSCRICLLFSSTSSYLTIRSFQMTSSILFKLCSIVLGYLCVNLNGDSMYSDQTASRYNGFSGKLKNLKIRKIRINIKNVENSKKSVKIKTKTYNERKYTRTLVYWVSSDLPV